MQLPGRLRATTLGDLLGALHRSTACGTLELAETTGRTHRVHLSKGLVTAVELDRASASLAELLRREDAIDDDTLRRSLLRAMASRRLHGEVLVRDFHLSPTLVDRVLRQQVMIRLSVLEELADAQVCYRVTVRPPRGALVEEPLAATDFLAGKKRARDRAPASEARYRSSRPHFAPGAYDTAKANAYRALGLPFGAETTELKQAYRRLVRSYHPDLHPGASHDERRSMSVKFSEVTAAYRALVA
jgi:DnaJ-domain-containing protein 1